LKKVAEAPDDNRLLRSIPAARIALIERIARTVSTDGNRSRMELQQHFVKAYFHGVGEEDLAEVRFVPLVGAQGWQVRSEAEPPLDGPPAE